jgi:hypothetical protein
MLFAKGNSFYKGYALAPSFSNKVFHALMEKLGLINMEIRIMEKYSAEFKLKVLSTM